MENGFEIAKLWGEAFSQIQNERIHDAGQKLLKTSAEEYCKSFVINYCHEHWDNINTEECELTTKKAFLEDLEDDFYLVTWFITEVLTWGLYDDSERYKVNENPLVYKLDGVPIKFTLRDDNMWDVTHTVKRKKIIYEYE